MADLSTEYLSYQSKLIALLESLDLGAGQTTVLPTRLTLINLVKIKLDELIPEGEGVVYALETKPNVSDPLDLYINGLLDESATNLQQTAPKEILKPKSAGIANGTPFTDTKTGYVVVPADYLRLHSFKMSEWLREVSEPITVGHPRYKLQKNEHVRGGIAKPVLVVNHKEITGTMSKILEYYSVPGGSHAVEKFFYIAETAAENLDDLLYPSLTWICAGKILQNIQEFEQAKLAFEQAKLCYTNLL